MTMTNRQPVTEAGRYPVTDAIRHHRPIVDRSADHYALIRCECGYRDHPAGWFAHLTVEVAERAEIEAQASQLSEPRTAELVKALRDCLHRLGNMWGYVEPDSSQWAAAKAVAEQALADPSTKLPEDMNYSLVLNFMAFVRGERALAATDATAPDAEQAHGPDCGCDCMLNAQAEDATWD